MMRIKKLRVRKSASLEEHQANAAIMGSVPVKKLQLGGLVVSRAFTQGYAWALMQNLDEALGALAENGLTSRVQIWAA